jgi:hypothetical protein
MYISTVTTTDTGVILVPNRAVNTVVNACNYRLIIACNVEATANLPVFIQTTLGNIPVLCKYGNTLYANQLNKRRMYCIGYGNENTNYEDGQFVIFSRVNPRGTIGG